MSRLDSHRLYTKSMQTSASRRSEGQIERRMRRREGKDGGAETAEHKAQMCGMFNSCPKTNVEYHERLPALGCCKLFELFAQVQPK